MARLIRNSDGANEEIPLDDETVYVIGRHPDTDITVSQEYVSRQHCRVSYQDGYFIVEDLESKNGTYVNGDLVSSAPLFSDDRITVGNAEFKFYEQGEGEASDLYQANGEGEYTTEFRERAAERAASRFSVEKRKEQGGETIEEVERELSAVCRIIDVVNREESLDRLFGRIMDHVVEMSNADRGYLFSGKEVGGKITPQVIRHSDDLPSSCKKSFSRSVVSECYESGYAILRVDPLDTSEDPSHSIMTQSIQSLMCVPMCCDEGTVGVIYVDKLRGDKKFRKRDLKILSAIANEAGIAVRRAQLSERVETLFSEAIRTLVRIIEVKDDYTHSHSERVTEVAVLLAKKLSFDRGKMRILRLAGLLHDVGKVAAPAELLKKPENLTESEYKQLRRHASYSARVVEGIQNAEPVARIVRHHHERWDGTGYPDELSGEDIPLASRILSVADAFDSIFGGRPYKSAASLDEVVEEIRNNCGSQFDPQIALGFVHALREDKAFRSNIFEVYQAGDDGPVLTEN